MNVKSKFLIAVATVVAGGLGLASSAFAGEGGAAGAASFQLDGAGNVESAAVAAGIGKDTAYAGATATNTLGLVSELEAFAVGTGGRINFTGTSVYVDSVGPDNNRATAQSNNLGGLTNINATTGTTTVLP